MNYAIIENDKIVNIAVTDSPLESNWVELQDGFSIGDKYKAGVFSKPVKTLEELTAEKIKQGEQYIKDTVKGAVDAFNTKYGVTFDSIYNMGIYKDDVNYPLHTQCATLIKWQNSMWSTARANQNGVIAGTMTDAEFIAALPIAPVV